MLPELNPTLFGDTLIHPLEREAKAKGKTTKVVFNICDCALIISIQIDANKLVWTLSMPRVCHKTSLLSINLLVIGTNNPLSLSLLLVVSELFTLFSNEEQNVTDLEMGWLTLYLPLDFDLKEE